MMQTIKEQVAKIIDSECEGCKYINTCNNSARNYNCQKDFDKADQIDQLYKDAGYVRILKGTHDVGEFYKE